MDFNNDKYIDFDEFSKILMGSMRAEFRLRALFTFYVYDKDKKGSNNDQAGLFLCIHQFPGYFGADDIHGIVILCNKCAEAGGKKTRSDKRVIIQESSGIPNFIDSSALLQTQTILKTLVENKIIENEDEVSAVLVCFLTQSELCKTSPGGHLADNVGECLEACSRTRNAHQGLMLSLHLAAVETHLIFCIGNIVQSCLRSNAGPTKDIGLA
jgi:hypothetical protein